MSYAYVPYERSVPGYDYNRRSDWGAVSPKPGIRPSNDVYDRIVLHHTASPSAADYDALGGDQRIRNIQNGHMNDPNTQYYDIAYHYLITPDCVLYEGRDLMYYGEHVLNANTGAIGIAVIINSSTEPARLTECVRRLMVELMCRLVLRFNIATGAIYGHKDFQPKDCPGSGIYGRIDDPSSADDFRGGVTMCLHDELTRRGEPNFYAYGYGYGYGYGTNYGYGYGYGGYGGYTGFVATTEELLAVMALPVPIGEMEPDGTKDGPCM